MGIGDHVSRLGVPFQDREVRELLVGGGDSDGAAPVDGGLIHMGDDRLGELSPGGRDGDLHKGVHSLGHVRHRDGAVRLGFLGADDLAVLDDIEYSAGEGIAAVVQLHQADLHLGVILEDQGNVRLAVPNESLLHLILIRAFGIALRGRHFLGGIAADGHGVPGDVCDIAALPGHKGAGEVVVHAGDLDNGPGKSLGGVVRVHLADAALTGNGGGVPECDGHGVVPVAGENDILRSCVVNLISGGRIRFRHGVSSGGQVFQSGRSVLPGRHVFGKGAAFRFNVELRPGKALAWIGGIHLFDDQGIAILRGDFQLPQDDLLDTACRVCAGARAGEAVLIGRTLAPYAPLSQVENILRPGAEGGTVLFLVNAGVVGALQGVEYCHQLLGASDNRVAHAALLIAPDDRLYPGVHVPGIAGAPNVVYTQGLCLVRKDAGGVGVVVGHHGQDGGIGDGGLVPPGLADQGTPHSAALRAAEAHRGFIPAGEIHLVEGTAAQGGGFVGYAGHAEPLQLDRVAGGQGRCREQAQDADQRQQQRRHAGPQGMVHFLHKPFPFLI